MVAFRQVLLKKQSAFGEVIAWLESETLKVSNQKGVNYRPLLQVTRDAGPL